MRTDGASIPGVFVPVIGNRLDSQHRDAAIVHDAYCSKDNEGTELYQTEPWEDVHRMFYEALLVNGTNPIKAKIMYAAVYLGGPRWNDPQRDITHVPEEDLQQELKWCIQLIEDRGASFEQVNDWMRKREPNLISGEIIKPKWAE